MDTNTGTYFRTWYEDNKAELSRKRKQKYHADKAYRESILTRQKTYRSTQVRESTKGSPKFRNVDGKSEQVFRVAAAAAMANCSVEFIRKYEKAGVIPRPKVDSPQRYYTEKQISLLSQFSRAMIGLKYERDLDTRERVLLDQRKNLTTNW